MSGREEPYHILPLTSYQCLWDFTTSESRACQQCSQQDSQSLRIAHNQQTIIFEVSVDISNCQFGPLMSAPNDIIAIDGDELVGFTLRGAITYITSSIGRPGHYVTWLRHTRGDAIWSNCTTGEQRSTIPTVSTHLQTPVLLYQRTSRRYVNMYSAEQSLHAWTSGSASGPFLKPLDPDQSRTRLDHWYRADTLGKSAPQFIRGLLATWPELNLCVDERPPKMTSTLRRLVCATTVHDEQPDISVQCARCNRWRLVLKEDLKSDVRSGNPPKFNCGLQFGWSCNVPQDPDAQPLYHGTINLPTNLAIQIPAILSLPPVSPDLDQPNVTLTLSGQPVTDSLLSSCRTMPVPGPTLRYKKRTVSYRTGMQEKRPLGSFEVAMDAIQHGTDKVVKSFTYFDSRDDFFRETAYTVHRNFYEIIPAGDPCCLYFDVEHYSPSQFHADGSPSDNKLAITVATICYEAKCQWPELAVNPSPLDQVVVTTASRSAGAAYKHSFHINFPHVGFINNHGALRAFARHLSSLDALQAMSANFQPMALIDTSVYSRNQNLRIIESWKHHPRLTNEMALGFYPPRLHTMESLLQTLVTNVLNVTHWTRETQAQVKRLYSICAVYRTWLVWMEMVAR